MNKLIYIVLAMVMITSCSEPAKTNVDDTFPEYDVIPYCLKLSSQFKKDDIEGLLNFSNIVFEDCLKEMKADYKWLKTNWGVLSSESKTFCKQAAGDPHENYRQLKICAQAVTCEDDDNNLAICVGHKKLKDILGH